MFRRYYVRTVCANGRHVLWGDWPTRQHAEAAKARADKRKPGLERRVDSYVWGHEGKP